MKKIFSFAIATLVFSTLFAATLGQNVDPTHHVSSAVITAASSEPGGL